LVAFKDRRGKKKLVKTEKEGENPDIFKTFVKRLQFVVDLLVDYDFKLFTAVFQKLYPGGQQFSVACIQFCNQESILPWQMKNE
jgi:hypothetical protein